MGNNRFKLRLTDVSGRQHIYHGQGVSDQAVQAWLDVNKRITQIEVLKVGGTGGPLVISEMWLVFDPLR
jgi:hypothetical protein